MTIMMKVYSIGGGGQVTLMEQGTDTAKQWGWSFWHWQ